MLSSTSRSAPAAASDRQERHGRSRRGGAGRLTVYLGAAPGVGKTYAMLGEAHRRLARGTDVVVGFVETHGRPHTDGAGSRGSRCVPRRTVDAPRRAVRPRWTSTRCWPGDRPSSLVDELAHTNVPGSRHAKRADDVAELLAAGIDVITTVNVQHLESLNDEVERITGIRQRETVPDDVVRDRRPDPARRHEPRGAAAPARPRQRLPAPSRSTRRCRRTSGSATSPRCASWRCCGWRTGSTTRSTTTDASTGSRRPWPARERIVVAVTGGPESETLLRRGARLAQRAAGSRAAGGARHRHRRAAPRRRRPRLARVQQLVDVARRQLPHGRRRGRRPRPSSTSPAGRTPP